jgi:hypothetical protein
MQRAKRCSKSQERKLMQVLQQKRERKTSDHHSPEWVTLFWFARRMLT